MAVTYGSSEPVDLDSIKNDIEAATSRLQCAIELVKEWGGDIVKPAGAVIEEVVECLRVVRQDVCERIHVPEWPQVTVSPELHARLRDHCKTSEPLATLEGWDEWMEGVQGHIDRFVQAVVSEALDASHAGSASQKRADPAAGETKPARKGESATRGRRRGRVA